MPIQPFLLVSSATPEIQMHNLHRYVPLAICIPGYIVTITGIADDAARSVENVFALRLGGDMSRKCCLP